MSIEWDGKGLPPLGCVCEIAPPIHNSGTSVRVLCHDEGAAVCRILEGDRIGSLCQFLSFEVRPIRTEAERQREEAIAKLKSYTIMGKDTLDEQQSLAVYDAIAAGKIPGVRLTDDASD